MRDPSRDGEQGFTLIELLMAITISGLIISALATGFIVGWKGTAGAHERFVASNGAHTLSTYFTSDVQSAIPALATKAAVDTGCASTWPAGTTNVLRLQWSEMTTATKMTAFSVSYRTLKVDTALPDDDPMQEWRLVRYACSGSQDLPTDASAILSAVTPTDHVLASHIHNPMPPSPHVTAATISGRNITLKAFAALAVNESTPYSYTVNSSMRTP